jgi:desulfoferrodoxin (superoxide reductase-like protein)
MTQRLMIASCVLSLLTPGCGKGDSGSVDTGGTTITKSGAVIISDPALMPPEQKYNTASNPHGWEKQRGDHTPFGAVSEAGDTFFRLEASVPFEGDGPHYVEHIILINHRHQEIKKQDFKRGNRTAHAIFEVKRNPEDRYYVIAKCSMHDTWVAEVSLPKLKKDKKAD